MCVGGNRWRQLDSLLDHLFYGPGDEVFLSYKLNIKQRNYESTQFYLVSYVFPLLFLVLLQVCNKNVRYTHVHRHHESKYISQKYCRLLICAVSP